MSAWHIQKREQGLKLWALKFRHSAAWRGERGKSAQLKCSLLPSSSRPTKCAFYACCSLYCCSERKQRVFTLPENNVISFFSPLALCDLVVTFETSTTHSWWRTQHHMLHTVCYTYTAYAAHCAWCYKSQSTVERPCAKRNSPSLTLASWGAVCDSIWQKYVEGVHVWAGTCPLCPVNGDSWHRCLYRVSMELCCRWTQQCLIWHLSVT